MMDVRRTWFWMVLFAPVAWVVLAGCGEPAPAPITAHREELAKVSTVAVLNMTDAPGGEEAKGSGKAVVTPLVTELIACPGIRVVERQKLAAILKEYDLAGAGIIDVDNARKMGKLAGADLVFIGEVTQYESQQEFGSVSVSVVSGGGTSRTHRVGLCVRAIYIPTGEVVYGGMGQGSSKGQEGGYGPSLQIAARKIIQPLQQFWEQQRAPKK